MERRVDPRPRIPGRADDWLPGRTAYLSGRHLLGLVLTLTALLTSLALGVLWPVPAVFWLYPLLLSLLVAFVGIYAYFGMLRQYRRQL